MLRPRNACAIIIPSYKLYSIGDGTMSDGLFLFVFFGLIIFICIVAVIVAVSSVVSAAAAVADEDGEEEE